MPIIAVQTSDTETRTIHSNAGIAPNDLRTIPHIHAAIAVEIDTSSVAKQTVSMVCGLAIRIAKKEVLFPTASMG